MCFASHGPVTIPGCCSDHKVQVRTGNLQRLHNGVLANAAGAADYQLHRLHLWDLQCRTVLEEPCITQSSFCAMLCPPKKYAMDVGSTYT